MQLLLAHKILIGSAMALCTLFGLRAFVHFARGGGAPDLLMGLGAALTLAALALYFRKLRRR